MGQDNGYPLPAVIDPDGRQCVVLRIPADPGHRRAFWGHLYELSYWWNWDRDAAHTGTLAAQVWRRVWDDAFDTFIASGGACPAAPSSAAPSSGVPSSGGFCDTGHDDFYDCEDDMIIHIGGKDYLVENCCCETRFYELSRTTVDIDDETGIAQIAGDINTDPGMTFLPVASEFETCYANKAVSYLLSRVADYFEAADDIMTTGFDFLASGLDEWLDVGAIVAGLLNGENASLLELIRGYTLEDIQALMADEDFIAVMVARWTYLGQVNRLDLLAWAKSAPYWYADIPVQNLLFQWAMSSLVLGYNKDLRVFAVECITGTNLGELNDEQELLDQYHLYEYNGNTYPIYDVPLDVALPKGETAPEYANSWPIPVEYTGDVEAMFIQYTVTGVVSNQVDVNINDGAQVHTDLGISSGIRREGTGTNEQELAVEAYTGLAWENSDDWSWATTASLSRAYGIDGAIVTINRLLVVGAALP